MVHVNLDGNSFKEDEEIDQTEVLEEFPNVEDDESSGLDSLGEENVAISEQPIFTFGNGQNVFKNPLT